jgi:hypothetical protein
MTPSPTNPVHCPYCQKPTGNNSIYAPDFVIAYGCHSCDTYFYYGAEQLEVTQMFFQIKGRQFYYRILHLENRIEAGPLNGDAALIKARRIPHWTPQTIAQKISNLLIFT